MARTRIPELDWTREVVSRVHKKKKLGSRQEVSANDEVEDRPVKVCGYVRLVESPLRMPTLEREPSWAPGLVDVLGLEEVEATLKQSVERNDPDSPCPSPSVPKA